MSRIRVIDRDGFMQGWVDARVGLPTYSGPVTRWTEKGSFWTTGSDGEERLWKAGNHQPCVYKSKLRKSDIIHERREG
ncbi:hypothetical protein CcrSwift_gp277 [Caulobacter phage CcrSwift]|uniref:Uncharacterized protein n=1 Tax=Caulobacter phage CcrSwift TaxID=2927984 RepID=K4JVZ9_9CAUD|nr:hypothetical protein D870_gp144 [Caulobacter phage CcrSwift]AFU88595.1 hypothetical protein CcrSwift_gp277 [Caulobacter phage CcrSwift]